VTTGEALFGRIKHELRLGWQRGQTDPSTKLEHQQPANIARIAGLVGLLSLHQGIRSAPAGQDGDIRAARVTVRLASPGRPRSTTVPLCGSPENIDAVNEGCDGSLNTCVPAIAAQTKDVRGGCISTSPATLSYIVLLIDAREKMEGE
jgi:hypothetical protein